MRAYDDVERVAPSLRVADLPEDPVCEGPTLSKERGSGKMGL